MVGAPDMKIQELLTEELDIPHDASVEELGYMLRELEIELRNAKSDQDDDELIDQIKEDIAELKGRIRRAKKKK